MINNNPYQAYRQNQINTVSQVKLIIMLFEGALKFLHRGLEGLDEKDLEKAHNGLIRTQDIIGELMVTINMDAGDLARSLFSIYDFMNDRLVQANMKKDRNMILEVMAMLEELKETWEQVNVLPLAAAEVG